MEITKNHIGYLVTFLEEKGPKRRIYGVLKKFPEKDNGLDPEYIYKHIDKLG